MSFKGKAFFNLLKMAHSEDPNSKVKSWQLMEYRGENIENLWMRLVKLGLTIDEKTFMAYADTCDSPEELIDCLWLDEGQEDDYQEAYLIIFEIWRRLLPKKQSLSLFGDELDRVIFLYDKGELNDEENLQNLLTELENILDQCADAGTEPEEVFEMISQYCAHDIETFLYDYIIEQMDRGDETYASELLDGFYDYVSDKRWFEFLRARLFSLSDSEESDYLLLGLVEQQEEDRDLELCFEICKFLVNKGDKTIFYKAANLLLEIIQKEEDLKGFLDMLAEFHRCLDQDYFEKAVLDILSKRSRVPAESICTEDDKKFIREYLQDP